MSKRGRDARLHLVEPPEGAAKRLVLAQTRVLHRDDRLDHARVVGEPGQVGAAARVADDRPDARVRVQVRQVQRDRRGLRHQRAVVLERRHLLVGVRVRRVRPARAVHARDLDVADLVVGLELLEQPDHARRARLRGVDEHQHGRTSSMVEPHTTPDAVDPDPPRAGLLPACCQQSRASRSPGGEEAARRARRLASFPRDVRRSTEAATSWPRTDEPRTPAWGMRRDDRADSVRSRREGGGAAQIWWSR